VFVPSSAVIAANTAPQNPSSTTAASRQPAHPQVAPVSFHHVMVDLLHIPLWGSRVPKRRWFCEDSLKTWVADPRSLLGRHDEAMDTRAAADPTGYRALVVDDEVPLAEVVGSYLVREMFDVTLAHNGPDALALAREIDPDVVVLDLALPGIDGLEVCRQLRTFSDAYVVMLTARDTQLDTIVGLSVGADDYVTKPFHPGELVARIRAMLRRPRTAATTVNPTVATTPPPREFGPLAIDVAGRQVFIDDEPILLTRTEFDVLAALSSRPAVVFTRRQLIESVWGDSWGGNAHLVDVHVGHLRRKLGDDPADPRYVITVRGVGYRMGSGQ
jgi:DNA-binding response OmpR family regulator